MLLLKWSKTGKGIFSFIIVGLNFVLTAAGWAARSSYSHRLVGFEQTRCNKVVLRPPRVINSFDGPTLFDTAFPSTLNMVTFLVVWALIPPLWGLEVRKEVIHTEHVGLWLFSSIILRKHQCLPDKFALCDADLHVIPVKIWMKLGVWATHTVTIGGDVCNCEGQADYNALCLHCWTS